MQAGRGTVLVEFSRTGGFAGNDDHTVLYHDGNAEVTREDYTTRITVPEETVTTLEQLLAGAGILQFNDEYPAPQEGADLFSYSLTCGGKTLHMEETAVPDVLCPTIDLLTDIIVSNAPGDVSPHSNPKFFLSFIPEYRLHRHERVNII